MCGFPTSQVRPTIVRTRPKRANFAYEYCRSLAGRRRKLAAIVHVGVRKSRYGRWSDSVLCSQRSGHTLPPRSPKFALNTMSGRVRSMSATTCLTPHPSSAGMGSDLVGPGPNLVEVGKIDSNRPKPHQHRLRCGRGQPRIGRNRPTSGGLGVVPCGNVGEAAARRREVGRRFGEAACEAACEASAVAARRHHGPRPLHLPCTRPPETRRLRCEGCARPAMANAALVSHLMAPGSDRRSSRASLGVALRALSPYKCVWGFASSSEGDRHSHLGRQRRGALLTRARGAECGSATIVATKYR